MAKIVITRSDEWNNLFREIVVYSDGQKIGTLSSGETKEFEMPMGHHNLKAKIDWCGSKDLPFTIIENETRAFKISGFQYASSLMLVFFGLIALNFLSNLTYNVFITILFIPIALIVFYFITFGRNKYLVVKKN